MHQWLYTVGFTCELQAGGEMTGLGLLWKTARLESHTDWVAVNYSL